MIYFAHGGEVEPLVTETTSKNNLPVILIVLVVVAAVLLAVFLGTRRKNKPPVKDADPDTE